jgi:hypothetical protein
MTYFASNGIILEFRRWVNVLGIFYSYVSAYQTIVIGPLDSLGFTNSQGITMFEQMFNRCRLSPGVEVGGPTITALRNDFVA